jgi:hypothetical protein
MKKTKRRTTRKPTACQAPPTKVFKTALRCPACHTMVKIRIVRYYGRAVFPVIGTDGSYRFIKKRIRLASTITFVPHLDPKWRNHLCRQ